MTNKVIKTASKLYEQDYYLWLKETIDQLKKSNFTEVDLPNLIEALEDMGKSEKRATYRNLKILLMHLLKYRHQPTVTCENECPFSTEEILDTEYLPNS